MSLSLLEERSSDSSPSVLVTFPDGYTDRLVLNKNRFNDGDKMEVDDGCNYIGHLLMEKAKLYIPSSITIKTKAVEGLGTIS